MYEVSLTTKVNFCNHTIPLSADYKKGGTLHFKGPASIEIEQLIQEINNLFKTDNLKLPPVLEGLTINQLGILFDKKDKGNKFAFTFDALFPIEGNKLNISVKITCEKKGNSYTYKFGGYISIGNHRFDLIFLKDTTSTFLLASYSQDDAQKIKLKRKPCYSNNIFTL